MSIAAVLFLLAVSVLVATRLLSVLGVRSDMNKHFEDTRYYLKRAGETAKKGVAEELAPVEERYQKLMGEEEEPEQGRLDEIRAELEDLQQRAEGEAKKAIESARERIERTQQES